MNQLSTRTRQLSKRFNGVREADDQSECGESSTAVGPAGLSQAAVEQIDACWSGREQVDLPPADAW